MLFEPVWTKGGGFNFNMQNKTTLSVCDHMAGPCLVVHRYEGLGEMLFLLFLVV